MHKFAQGHLILNSDEASLFVLLLLKVVNSSDSVNFVPDLTKVFLLPAHINRLPFILCILNPSLLLYLFGLSHIDITSVKVILANFVIKIDNGMLVMLPCP